MAERRSRLGELLQALGPLQGALNGCNVAGELHKTWPLPGSACDSATARVCLQGKGANTPFILESRGLQRSETMSSLLERNSDIKDLMNQGELVPDTMVCSPLTLCSRGRVCRAAPPLHEFKGRMLWGKLHP